MEEESKAIPAPESKQTGLRIDMTAQQLRSVAQQLSTVDAPTISELCAGYNYLRSIEPVIGSFVSVTLLDMSVNLITRIENLAPLRSVTQLFLANNKISEIGGLDGLTSLKALVRFYFAIWE